MPEQATRTTLLASLAGALKTLAKRLQAQETTKRLIFLLAARAEAIATQAWELSATKGRGSEAAAQALVEQLKAFAEGFTLLSNRVADDIATGRSLAVEMVAHATRLLEAGSGSDPGGASAAMLVKLRPLAANLATLAERQQGDGQVAKDTAALAERATQLAERSKVLTGPAGARNTGRTAAELHKALLGIADDAGAVSLRIMTESALLKAAVTEMAAGVRQLSAAPEVRQQDAATTRLRQVVRKGFAAMDWHTPPVIPRRPE